MSRRFPPFGGLQAFLAVARTSSFSQASEILHISQSSISRQILQLENHFRSTLFLRSTRRVVLTDAGQRLLPYIEQLVALLIEADQAVTQQPQTVTLRVHPSLAIRWLMPRLPQFYREHAHVRVDIDTAWARRPDFELEGIDGMIEYGVGPFPGLLEDRLWEEQLTPVCRPRLVDDFNDRKSFEGLVLLHMDRTYETWERWAAQAQVSLAGARHLVFDTLDLAVTAAQQGQGLALADLALVGAAIDDGLLVQAHPVQLDVGMGYSLIAPKTSSRLDGFTRLRTWLRQQAEVTRHDLSTRTSP
jgi:LysR family glycine cleavage system transcriptional activator